MASKTVNLSVQAYAAAEAAKRPGESFSDLMLRAFPRTSPLDLVGLLTDEEADAMMEAIADGRRRSMERANDQARMWWS